MASLHRRRAGCKRCGRSGGLAGVGPGRSAMVDLENFGLRCGAWPLASCSKIKIASDWIIVTTDMCSCLFLFSRYRLGFLYAASPKSVTASAARRMVGPHGHACCHLTRPSCSRCDGTVSIPSLRKSQRYNRVLSIADRTVGWWCVATHQVIPLFPIYIY